MKATDFLQAAIDVQAQRGRDYDKPEGERSMAATVKAFNAITGRDLPEAEGWLMLQVLKDVRQWQQPGRYHHDSALDGVAYSALKAEALHAAGRGRADIGDAVPHQSTPDMSDWRNWQVGDFVERTSPEYPELYMVGDTYQVFKVTEQGCAVGDKLGSLSRCWFDAEAEPASGQFRWHSRPEKAE